MRKVSLVMMSALAFGACDDGKTPEGRDSASSEDVSGGEDSLGEDISSDDSQANASDATADVQGDSSADVQNDSSLAQDADVAAQSDAEDTASTDASDVASDADISKCEYFDNPVFLPCDPNRERPSQVLEWEAVGGADAGCPTYYSKDGDEFPSLEALADAKSCDTTCVYRAFQAVSFIRCDGQGRSGYELFTAPGEGCLEALYRTADGLFTDLCVWPAYLCYCGDPR
jgi:hypothetical protein